jgi:hypothetical protein
MVDAVYQHGVKLLISTAGGAGPAAHVDFLKEIISDLINRKNYSLKVATIYSDVSKETVLRKLKQGKMSSAQMRSCVRSGMSRSSKRWQKSQTLSS